jgi:hypothetical protein
MVVEEYPLTPDGPGDGAIPIYDECEIHENCTVEILRNSKTGEQSIGWWQSDTMKLQNVFVVSFFREGDSEATVTVFNNRHAAETFYKSCEKDGVQHIALDECPLYGRFFKKPSVETTPIELLGFKPRTYQCLKRAGIHSLDDILGLDYTDMWNIRGLGEAVFAEIHDKIHELGFKLKWEE